MSAGPGKGGLYEQLKVDSIVRRVLTSQNTVKITKNNSNTGGYDRDYVISSGSGLLDHQQVSLVRCWCASMHLR